MNRNDVCIHNALAHSVECIFISSLINKAANTIQNSNVDVDIQNLHIGYRFIGEWQDWQAMIGPIATNTYTPFSCDNTVANWDHQCQYYSQQTDIYTFFADAIQLTDWLHTYICLCLRLVCVFVYALVNTNVYYACWCLEWAHCLHAMQCRGSRAAIHSTASQLHGAGSF